MKIKTLFFLSLILILSCNKDLKRAANPLKNTSESLLVYDSLKIAPSIDSLFTKLHQKTRFNGNVLFAHKNNIVFKKSYGWANYQSKRLLNIRTSFQLASVSKPITATAVLMLVDQGKISLDDLVQYFLPNFPYKGITIRMLLSHRSGLSNYIYFCERYTDKITPIYNNEVLDLMTDSIPLLYYPPNYRFNYCNTNYMLLALIVEKVSALPFADFLEKNIFVPCGMQDTRLFIRGKRERIPNSATGYHYKWTQALPVYQDGVLGDKGIYSTVEDLFRFQRALLAGDLISKELLDESFSPQSPERKGARNYGLGWRILKCKDGSDMIYHSGWWRGNNALLMYDSKNEAILVVLANIRTKVIFGTFQYVFGLLDTTRLPTKILLPKIEKTIPEADSSIVI